MYPVYEEGDYYLWLLKPSDSNRGRGIQLFDTLETLEKLLRELKEGTAEYVNIQENDLVEDGGIPKKEERKTP